MKNSLTRIALGIAVALSAAQAGAAVLNFDDLGPGSYFSGLTNAEYRGFRFGDTTTANWFWNDTVPATSPFTASSGNTWLGLLGGNPAPAITSAVDFVFNGASFAGFEFIFYKLYLDGNEVSSSNATPCVLGSTHTFCASDYSGMVDSVVIFSNPGFPDSYYAMDDFTYNASATVSEPGSFALVAGALVALGTAARRRRKAA
jgi:hypothetical protein